MPKPYHLTRAQGLKALGLDKPESVVTPAALLAIEQKGGVAGVIARHVRKWLPTDDSTTTVPLEDADAKRFGLQSAEPAA